MLTVNPTEKQIIERITTSDNVSFLVDNKNFLCQHEKLHPLTAIKGKWISETMHRYIEKSFNKDHLGTSKEPVGITRTGRHHNSKTYRKKIGVN